MNGSGGIWVTGLCIATLWVGTAPVVAQDALDDAAAREYFERGRAAFEQADYEAALVYFRHAYRLSRRGELQYNIGVAADRLQREEEALEAFQHYLDETDQPTRRAEVSERIAALRRSIAERQATKRALEEAKVRYEPPASSTRDGGRVKTSAIAGGSALAAVGIAGIAAMSVGLAKDGSCADAIDARCVTEHSATAWTWVYGGVGIAALAGSVTWLTLSATRQKKARRTTEVRLAPSQLIVRGSF